MANQQLRLQLIELIALLFPFLAVLIRMTIMDVERISGESEGSLVHHAVLFGGGLSLVFLVAAAMLLVNTMIQDSDVGLNEPVGLALALVLLSLLLFGSITLVFIRGVMATKIE